MLVGKADEKLASHLADYLEATSTLKSLVIMGERDHSSAYELNFADLQRGLRANTTLTFLSIGRMRCLAAVRAQRSHELHRDAGSEASV